MFYVKSMSLGLTALGLIVAFNFWLKVWQLMVCPGIKNNRSLGCQKKTAYYESSGRRENVLVRAECVRCPWLQA